MPRGAGTRASAAVLAARRMVSTKDVSLSEDLHHVLHEPALPGLPAHDARRAAGGGGLSAGSNRKLSKAARARERDPARPLPPTPSLPVAPALGGGFKSCALEILLLSTPSEPEGTT